MPNFEPEGIIRIGRVNFDNSYKHTMTFGSASAQSSYFSGVCTESLSKNDYTYIRQNNTIRVPFNAERLYTYNYVMYQNANYGSKWFYAFIVGVNYLNKQTTELVLELDVMQTWYFDYELTECFVEREHVNDDTIGEHLNPEPEFPFDMVAKGRYSDGDLSEACVVLQTNAEPKNGALGDIYTSPVDGGFYNRVFSGCKYYAYPNDAGGRDRLTQFINGLNQGGGAESISGIFMFPKKLLPSVGGDDGVQEDTAAVSYTKKTSRPTSLGGGYVPHNNKLFTYPYCYCLFDDNNGHSAEYRYEFWGGATNTYSVQSALDPTAMCIIAPQNYNGIANNVTESFTFALTAQCSWVYSSYQNWVAQNTVANLGNAAFNIALMAVPAARGLSAAAKVLGVAKTSKAGLAARGASTSQINRGATMQAARDEARAAVGAAGAASAGLGAYGIASQIGEISRQSKIPNIQKGASSGNTLFSNEYMTYNVCQMVIREEYARIIDGFMDMYGYQVDSVKTPNRTGRPNWNYVKCQNACMHGNVPADDMALINEIYNSGITFWHTGDIGNYSLSNK